MKLAHESKPWPKVVWVKLIACKLSVAICSRVFPAFGYVHTQLIEAPRSELSPRRCRNMYKFWAWTDERGDNMKSSSTQTNITFPMPNPQDAKRRKIFFFFFYFFFFCALISFQRFKLKRTFYAYLISNNGEKCWKFKRKILRRISLPSSAFFLIYFLYLWKRKNVEAN